MLIPNSELINELTLVAFDLETSGAYPIGDEIVEFGAVKWKDGAVIDKLEILVKPSRPMGEAVIRIHGITNEMVADCPSLSTEIQKIHSFFDGAVLMAHHAPFDVGFVAVEFERYGLKLPTRPVLCTSLLARKWIPESVNHKLQTLVRYLKIEGGAAHRAYDDAFACLQVGFECLRRAEAAGTEMTFQRIYKSQGKAVEWDNFRLLTNSDEKLSETARAVLEGKDLEIQYSGGSLRGQSRRITPKGIVRNPDGDYISAICHVDRAQKRFYFSKIEKLTVRSSF